MEYHRGINHPLPKFLISNWFNKFFPIIIAPAGTNTSVIVNYEGHLFHENVSFACSIESWIIEIFGGIWEFRCNCWNMCVFGMNYCAARQDKNAHNRTDSKICRLCTVENCTIYFGCNENKCGNAIPM